MKQEELYEDLQGTKVGFVLTVLVLIYCYSELIDFDAANLELKAGVTIVGFLIVSFITAHLLIRLLDIRKALTHSTQAIEQSDNGQ